MPKKIDDEQIFRAAIQAVIAKGYAGATTRQMARMAGVSEVTLFRRYGSKAALVCRALQAIAEEMDFEAVVRYTGDVQADLVRIVERYQRLVARYGPFFAALLPEIQRHSELQPLLARPWGVWQRVAALLRRYQEEGVLIEEPPWHALAGLLGPLVFAGLLQGMDREAVPTSDAEERVRRFLFGRRKRSANAISYSH